MYSINSENENPEVNHKKDYIELGNVNEGISESVKKRGMPLLNSNDEIKIKDGSTNSKGTKIDIIILSFNTLSFVFYCLSLEGCYLSQDECLPLLLTTWLLVRVFIFGILNALMTCILIYLIIFKIVKKYHLIYTILFYIYIYYYDHGTTLDHHGIYNILFVPIFFIVFFFLIGAVIIIIKSIRKKKKIPLIIIGIIILYIIIQSLIISNSFKNSCETWGNGLNSTMLDNSLEYNCTIKVPKKCYIFKINKYLDFSSLMFKDCSPDYDQEKDHELFLEYLRVNKSLQDLSELNHFGFPITVNNPIYNLNNEEQYYKTNEFVLKNIILMDLYNNKEKKYYDDSILPPEIEIFYDKKNKKRNIKINVIKNETLSKERNEILNNPKNKNISLYKNIMVIYIDCISRIHFLRTMKKTSAFIEKFMKYDNDLGLSSYQFMKYQTFAAYTNPNVVPMFYSSHIGENNVHILKYLKELGYVTAHTHNMCVKESFEIDLEYAKRGKIVLDEYDHENIAMFCEPNYVKIDEPYPILGGPYGIQRRCLYGKDTSHHMFEYGKQFWEKYKDNKRYLRFNFQDAHEFSGNVVKYLDEPLYNFLNELYEKKMLEDTAIFLMSDHGNSYFDYYYHYILRSDDSRIERVYGTFFVILPNYKKNNNEEYLNNIHIHQQALITPFDIHDTIVNIAFGNNLESSNELYSQRGKSLISKFEYKNRYCEIWEGSFVDLKKDCLCQKK